MEIFVERSLGYFMGQFGYSYILIKIVLQAKQHQILSTGRPVTTSRPVVGSPPFRSPPSSINQPKPPGFTVGGRQPAPSLVNQSPAPVLYPSLAIQTPGPVLQNLGVPNPIMQPANSFSQLQVAFLCSIFL